MKPNDSRIYHHYQQLQESLSELIDPQLQNASQSLLYITLNQAFTRAEQLFELAEGSLNLSDAKQALLAKLANHIETCKESGMKKEFRSFIDKELLPALVRIKHSHIDEFDLAS